MKLKKITTEADIIAALDAETGGRPRVELTSADGGAIRSIRIGQLHVALENYNFRVEREVEHEKVKRQKVVAKVKGFPDAVSYFETYSEAADKRDSYDHSIVDVTGPDDAFVLINAAGDIIAEVDGDKATTPTGDEIPF